jgi:hypothetical protein
MKKWIISKMAQIVLPHVVQYREQTRLQTGSLGKINIKEFFLFDKETGMYVTVAKLLSTKD